MFIRHRSGLTGIAALLGPLALVACAAQQPKKLAAPNVQVAAQVATNLATMAKLTFEVTCPAMVAATVKLQCTATAPTGEQLPVDLEKGEDGFEIVKVGAVFAANLIKATQLSLAQFGFEAGDVTCPPLALDGTEPTCTTQVEGVEMIVKIMLGEQLGARVESGLIDVSTIEKHVVETTALPGGVTSADCGKKFYLAKPGSLFNCLAKGPEEETTVYIRIEDAAGRVTVSLTPFED